MGRWYKGGQTNICHNCVDVHLRTGRRKQTALIYDSAYTKVTKSYSYEDLQDHVGRFATLLNSLDVNKGDRVLIYMPMIPEAVFAMLACARIGAIHSVVFGGFAAKELANRVTDCKPKILVTASCGIEPNKLIPYRPIVDEALVYADHSHIKRIIVQRHNEYFDMGADPTLYVDYHSEMQKIKEVAECAHVDSTHPLYILYTSGTTGQPKGIVRDTGGTAVGLNWVMDYVFGVQPGDTWFAASDIGWVVGHSFIVYGPLLRGATTILFEGKPVGTPDPGAFWRVVEQHKATSIYAAPTAVRIIKKEDYEGDYVRKYNLVHLRAFNLVGERCDPDTIHWLQHRLPHVTLNDTWW